MHLESQAKKKGELILFFSAPKNFLSLMKYFLTSRKKMVSKIYSILFNNWENIEKNFLKAFLLDIKISNIA